jgi:cellulose synthase/poly-beta-1,6-N-acetylglucosamine synthase-like glycosyltransferase
METRKAPDINFSIIVPTRDRLALLRQALEALLSLQSDPDSFEIIVADDGSRDGTAEYLQGLTQGGRVQGLSRPHGGAAAARNNGIRVARGRILVFTDDDCVVPPDWLEHLAVLFASTGADAVGGRADNVLPSVFSQVHQDMAAFLYRSQNRNPDRPRFLTTNNFACRREALLKAGPFDTRFVVGGEDRELVLRLQEKGFRVVYAPELVVRHHHHFTLNSFVSHYVNLGRGSYLLHKVIPEETGRRARFEPGELAGAMRFMIAGHSPWSAVRRVALFGLANLVILGAAAGMLLRNSGALEKKSGLGQESVVHRETPRLSPVEKNEHDLAHRKP